MDSPKPHTLVLAIDGLRAAAIGSYGATAHSTPGFDQLATEAATYDWCFADSPNCLVTYDAICDVLQERKKGKSEYSLLDSTHSLLATDSADLLNHRFAKEFSRTIEIQTDDCKFPAEKIGDTQLAKSVAQFANQLVKQFESLKEPTDSIFAWLDLTGFYGPWDAPVELSESLLDEEDPRFEITPLPPESVAAELDQQDWCDARFAAVCRYAAQAMVLDACIESFIELIEGLLEGESFRILLFGTRGYPLGEHGRIGGVDERLYSEQQQVPLLVRSENPMRRFTRIQKRTKLSLALAKELSGQVAEQEEDSVLLTAEDGTLACFQNNWFLRQPPSAHDLSQGNRPEDCVELYLKPDDKWEQNDVASLKQEVIESMLASISDSRKAGQTSLKAT